ncbi:MAG TPA: hypothetical protein VFH97_06740 [Gemmatimonadales bacterium]|nr:hypothetical protein [Gemmatimonadales bacterium]
MNRRLLAAGVLVLGCRTGGPRPLRPAAEEVVSARASLVHPAAIRAVTDQGIPLRFTDPAAGVVETDYVDISTFRQDAIQYPAAERLIRLRIVVTPHEESPASRLTVYAIYAPFRNSLGDVRRGERAVPPDHPAMDLVRRIVEQVRKTTEGG